MSLLATTERALVLRIAPNGESFQRIDILTKEVGYILCLKRVSKKNSLQTAAPDLFDTADIHLESPRQGTARFVKEYQLVHRRSSIGQSYRKLQCASEFCSLMVQNAPHMAEPTILYEITERTLNAFGEKGSPEIISLKALYLILKDEGYPVRESWWPQLSARLREPARQLINDPSPESAAAEQIKICTEIHQNLRNWLSYETDLVLPHL
jgi:recombinational DNA repair protein (RecF pathway)